LAVGLEGLKGTKFLGNMEQLRQEIASKEQASRRLSQENLDSVEEAPKKPVKRRKTKKEREMERSLEELSKQSVKNMNVTMAFGRMEVDLNGEVGPLLEYLEQEITKTHPTLFSTFTFGKEFTIFDKPLEKTKYIKKMKRVTDFCLVANPEPEPEPEEIPEEEGKSGEGDEDDGEEDDEDDFE
jgi:hypothetical protein